MATGTNTTSVFTSQFRRFYEKNLLEHAINTLQLDKFAKMADLPKQQGSKTIRFFRPIIADSSRVATLTEGTPISTFQQMDYETVDVDLVQYGEAMKFSDILGYTQLLNVMKDGIVLMGEDAALKADDLTLAAICAGTSTKRYSGGAANFAALSALSAGSAVFSGKNGLDACTTLKINKAPRIGGEYIGIVPPQISRDIQQDATWIDVSKYAAARQVFKGEIGSLFGIRYVETTNAWIEGSTEGTRDNGGAIYSSIFTGRDSYGVTKLSGDSPYKPAVIVVDKADKADPLNQTMTAGWKAFYAAMLLNGNWCVVNRSKTLYS